MNAARYWLDAMHSHQRTDGGEAPRRPLVGQPPAWSGALAGLLLAAIVLWAVTTL
jgi:hypothetical protein